MVEADGRLTMGGFKTSTLAIIGAGFAALIAWQRDDLAAGYVAVGGAVIFYMLHVIEVKLNKLLDDRGLRVDQAEIDHPTR